ncbi:MAG TPA: histidine kinase [Bacteroidales bacterium]|nr:histidine kinase [Bacteroidales bacterium]
MKYLTTLSKFMRELLETGKQQSVALVQELELAQKYVTLEALRFDQDLDFAVHTPEALKDRLTDIQLPPMVLQPFLENAIWHGLIPSTKAQKVLHIELQQHQQELRISIIDNGVGRSRKPQTPTKGHSSMGLQITRDRIALYNKMTHNTLRTQTIDLVDEQQQAAGTRVELSINLPAS